MNTNTVLGILLAVFVVISILMTRWLSHSLQREMLLRKALIDEAAWWGAMKNKPIGMSHEVCTARIQCIDFALKKAMEA